MTRRVSETADWFRFVSGGEDSHGQPIGSFAPAVPLPVLAVEEMTSTQPRTPGHDRLIRTATVYVPADSELSVHDRVSLRGRTYAVESEPRSWWHPSMGPMGMVVDLRHVQG